MSDNSSSATQRKVKLKPIVVTDEMFMADPIDVLRFQSDLPCMEFPVFSLKTGVKKTINYKFDDTEIKITPSLEYGLPSINDKDIWIYCISKLMQAVKDGKSISKTIEFSMIDYLKVTNRPTGGRDYLDAKESLARITGTTIYTNIETNNIRQNKGFGLIQSYEIVEAHEDQMTKILVCLPDWLFNSIISRSLLTISSEYFSIRKPLKKRLYEIARKHCGNKNGFLIRIDTLHGKSGSGSSLIKFRQMIKEICKDDDLPEYFIRYLSKKDVKGLAKIDMLEFIHRRNRTGTYEDWLKAQSEDPKPEDPTPEDPTPEDPTPEDPNKKPKRKRITKAEAGQLARPGEEWPDLLKRIGSEYHVIFPEPDED